MGFRKYILDENNQPVLCGDVLVWGRWFEKSDSQRRVGLDEMSNGKVSTIFLGLDHSFSETAKPILWETMVFGGLLDGEQVRYDSLEAAKAGHAAMVERVLKGQVEPL